MLLILRSKASLKRGINERFCVSNSLAAELRNKPVKRVTLYCKYYLIFLTLVSFVISVVVM